VNPFTRSWSRAVRCTSAAVLSGCVHVVYPAGVVDPAVWAPTGEPEEDLLDTAVAACVAQARHDDGGDAFDRYQDNLRALTQKSNETLETANASSATSVADALGSALQGVSAFSEVNRGRVPNSCEAILAELRGATSTAEEVEARVVAWDVAWAAVDDTESTADLEAFVAGWPDPPHADQARDRIRRIESVVRESGALASDLEHALASKDVDEVHALCVRMGAFPDRGLFPASSSALSGRTTWCGTFLEDLATLEKVEGSTPPWDAAASQALNRLRGSPLDPLRDRVRAQQLRAFSASNDCDLEPTDEALPLEPPGRVVVVAPDGAWLLPAEGVGVVRGQCVGEVEGNPPRRRYVVEGVDEPHLVLAFDEAYGWLPPVADLMTEMAGGCLTDDFGADPNPPTWTVDYAKGRLRVTVVLREEEQSALTKSLLRSWTAQLGMPVTSPSERRLQKAFGKGVCTAIGLGLVLQTAWTAPPVEPEVLDGLVVRRANVGTNLLDGRTRDLQTVEVVTRVVRPRITLDATGHQVSTEGPTLSSVTVRIDRRRIMENDWMSIAGAADAETTYAAKRALVSRFVSISTQ
jgi:hypothetical protein